MTQDYNYWANRPKNDPQKDWTYNEQNWLEGYLISANHPHRQLIIDAVRNINPESILEIGCSVGPNLYRLKEVFPEINLAGIDVSEISIKSAKECLPNVLLKTGNYLFIPFPDKSFDMILADATLMYAGPKEIKKAMSEINRVARMAVIIVDRFDKSLDGKIVGHVWGRNYTKILENLGFKVEETKITKETWPTSKNWVKYGRLFIARRA